jgi:CheY-like chemotaxis protein
MADGSSECLVLLVEDDTNDVFFFERVLKKLGFAGTLVHKTNPTEAWIYLKESAQAPDLVVCDGMWREDGGKDLVEWMRVHPRFKHIPFVIYSGVKVPFEEALRAAGVTVVLQKSADMATMAECLRPALELLPQRCRPWLPNVI